MPGLLSRAFFIWYGSPCCLMALIQHNPAITRQQIADTIGKDIRTIGRAMAKLQQAGRLRRVGSDKSGHWEVINE
ncbi:MULTISPECIES: winged helix-turn-helix transcriptional regulator [unclassified Halomonas]|uniref:winged helix-turn-helix transcriptional regulator n=1 Tax=unclassified Halomonas TaxID=2609666 RepID=UPI003335FA06